MSLLGLLVWYPRIDYATLISIATGSSEYLSTTAARDVILSEAKDPRS